VIFCGVTRYESVAMNYTTSGGKGCNDCMDGDGGMSIFALADNDCRGGSADALDLRERAGTTPS